MRRAPNVSERHLATLRKYAPSKALGSQGQSPGARRAEDINALLHRWKPCPADVSN
jgi:hypothetical protein